MASHPFPVPFRGSVTVSSRLCVVTQSGHGKAFLLPVAYPDYAACSGYVVWACESWRRRCYELTIHYVCVQEPDVRIVSEECGVARCLGAWLHLKGTVSDGDPRGRTGIWLRTTVVTKPLTT